jgi:chemotaxis protein MotB
VEPVVSKAANPSPIPADIADDLLIDDVVVSTSDDGIMFRIPNKVFFASGQATLSSRGQGVLKKVADLINSQYQGHMVRVDGHTDDTPIRKVRNRFPTNWELSTARACSVVRFLVEKCDVNAKSVFPAGFSYYRPVTFGRSSSAKQQNRRVEITVLNKRV